jgi:DNA invertase Pin-like site-specific DNA recombinase
MKVAIYARVSTTRQADNDLSIPDQLRQMRVWAEFNNHVVVSEYVEAGASATNDRRPEFQKMIADAQQKPAPFQLIIVHSFSRFFRDLIDFGNYERDLFEYGVKVMSITQPTADDSLGEMLRRMIQMFDQHSSSETSKHTSRSMQENAKQGYFNGSRAPFGYKSETTDISGSRGRKKKKLVIDEVEADVVKTIYRIYLSGLDGHVLGIKEIAKHLSNNGMLMRGFPWSIQKVHEILSSSAYMGDYYFNVRDSKRKTTRPPEEWIKTTIPAIIDAATFETVRLLRKSRAPQSSNAIPKTLSSPVLLSSIIKCGKCGARMSLATGKSGTYRYYKCTSRHSKGNHTCQSRNLPMDKMDQLILGELTGKVLQQDNLQSLMEEMRKRIQSGKDNRSEKIAEFERQIKILNDRENRLLEGVESGIVELNELTHRRFQQLKTSRAALLIQITEARTSAVPLEIEFLKPTQVDAFGAALRQLLHDKDSSLLRSYV